MEPKGQAHPPSAAPTCPYCGNPAVLVHGTVVYPHRPDLKAKQFWNCAPCGAYVGCHPGTTKPLGRLADRELRNWKRNAHTYFDPIWQTGKLERTKAYGWLAKELGMPQHKCHIGMFDVETCRRVVAACRRFTEELEGAR